MSDLLNSASLVMIPSGYKEDVVYSQIPTDGSGDLSFTRASNGTRVNSAGLVEVAPWNLLEYSEQFDNVTWGKVNATITANTTVAPNGTTTADTLVITSGGYLLQQPYLAISIGFSVTISIYAKNQTNNFLTFGGATPAGTDVYTIQDVGNGWYRHINTRTFTASGTSLQFIIYDQVGTNYIWGAQLNIGSTAKPYFPTTDRLNVPRLTYQNGGGGCPSLLLEKQSTNLAIYSQQFNSGYTTYNGTTTDNFAIAPDGTQTAAKVETVSFNSATLRQTNGGLTNGQPYTLSLYIKQGSGITAFLDISDTASTVNITPTNEWVRYTYTANWNTSLNFLDIELRGTNGAYCYIWGCQLEAGTYATSYIPTTSSSATRVADFATTNNISSLFGSTEGSFFIEMSAEFTNPNGSIPLFLRSSANSAFNYATYLQFGSNNITLWIYNGGTQQVGITSSAIFTQGQKLKIAFAYKQNDFAFYVNGNLIGTDTSGNISASLAFIDFGTYNLAASTFQYNGAISEAVLFPTRLTNAELASLTTL